MRKFIISLLCLLMLAGTASAYIQSVTISPNPIIAGQPYSIYVTVSDPGNGPGDIGKKFVQEETIDPLNFVDDGLGTKAPKLVNFFYSGLNVGSVCTISDASIILPTANYQYRMILKECEIRQFPECIGSVYLPNTAYSMTVTAIAPTSTNPDPTGSIPPSTSVPEFPSVAVPVAAILGLMFVVGRKKEIN